MRLGTAWPLSFTAFNYKMGLMLPAVRVQNPEAKGLVSPSRWEYKGVLGRGDLLHLTATKHISSLLQKGHTHACQIFHGW